MKDLDQEAVRGLLNYNPGTGDFSWISPKPCNVKADGRAGSISGTGYRQIMIDGRSYQAHRIAWLWMTGVWPANLIDHRDLNKSNNAWSNLREATKSQNGKNAGVRRDNTVGLKGVSRKGNRYQARIVCDGKREYLGLFQTAEEAHTAYIKASHKFNGEFARAA